jgi:hypothetical protein
VKLVVLDLAIEPCQVLIRGSTVGNSIVELVSSVRVASLPTKDRCSNKARLDRALVVYSAIT